MHNIVRHNVIVLSLQNKQFNIDHNAFSASLLIVRKALTRIIFDINMNILYSLLRRKITSIKTFKYTCIKAIQVNKNLPCLKTKNGDTSIM